MSFNKTTTIRSYSNQDHWALSLLDKFNKHEISQYSEIIDTENGKELFYAIPTKKTTQIQKINQISTEIMDYGYPQITEANLLKKYITQGDSSAMLSNPEKIAQVTIQATGVISWRGENIRHRKNEVYIDVVENVHLLLSTRGTILRNHVMGQVMMKTQLSGMPECKFGINDKLLIRAAASAQYFYILYLCTLIFFCLFLF